MPNKNDGSALPADTKVTGVESKEAETSGVRSLVRGLSIVQCFDTVHPEWSLVDICDRTGLHISTAYRLAKTLVNAGFLEIDARSGKYHLGPSLLRTAYLAISDVELARTAHPYMEQLATQTGETVDMGVLVPEGVLFIAQVLTSRPFKPNGRVGLALTGYGNGHRQILLAHAPPHRQELALARARRELTPAAYQRLLERLETAREEGVAHDRNESTVGVYGLAVPIRDISGEVRASLGMVAPEERLNQSDIVRCIEQLKDTARLISQELGHCPAD